MSEWVKNERKERKETATELAAGRKAKDDLGRARSHRNKASSSGRKNKKRSEAKVEGWDTNLRPHRVSMLLLATPEQSIMRGFHSEAVAV
jgi:hypothetical protein